MLIGTDAKADLIAGLDTLRGFGALAIHFHLAARDRVGRQRPRLEEPGGTQPLVDANGGEVVGHARILASGLRPASIRETIEHANAEWEMFRRAIVMLCAAAFTASAQSTLPDSAGSKIDAVFSRYARADAPGCAVGVYQNGRIAFEKGYGSANIEYGVPITPTSPFIMGSVSKQFTAAAIALLVEQGKLRLDDEVHTYVPELRDYGKPITIDQLVHHTSGVRDFWTLVQTADMRNDDGYTVDDILRLASRQRHLNFDPG